MAEPIRVLQVVTQMHRAGLETMLMNYYRHMDREKIQFDFLVHREGEYDYNDEIYRLGGKIFHVPPITVCGFQKYLKALDCFFKQHGEYKIVHCHLDALSGFALRAAKKVGIPCRIAHSHNNGFDQDKKLLLRYLAKRSIPCVATHFWGCGRDALAFMFGKSILCSPYAKIVPNAIALNDFSYKKDKRREYRERLGLEKSYVIGHIGRFSYQKNQSFLLDIFSDVLKSNSSAILLLIGDGEDLKKIKKKATKLNMDKVVHFLQVRDDVPNLMNAMDIFVCPSRFEGFGMVLLEAQANGLSCIASTKVASEINITGNVCFLSLKENSSTWAETILSTSTARYNEDLKLKAAGYDISSASVLLQNEYLKLWNESDL